MGFFSKLFKAGDEPDGTPSEEPQAEANESAAGQQAAAPKAASPQASAQASPQASPQHKTQAAPQASASAKQPPPSPSPSPSNDGERAPTRGPVQRSPLPPPPPPPLGATALPIEAAIPPAPAVVAPPPPPPAGTAKSHASAATPLPVARASSAGRPRAVKPAAPPKPAPTAVKTGGAAIKRNNATLRGLPVVLPVQSSLGVSEPEPRSDAAIGNEFAFGESDAIAADPEQAPTLEFVALTPEQVIALTPEPAPELAPIPEPGPPRTVDTLDNAVEDAVDRLLRQASEPPAAQVEARRAAAEAERAADQRAAAETFRALISAGAAQVRELMFQLSVGRTPRHWAASCRPVIAPFLAGARQIELADLSAALELFDAALEQASNDTGAYVRPESSSAIEHAYARLAAQLPDAFAAPNNGDGRRLRLLESLLLQVPAMYRRTLNKLYGAGLGSLEQLSSASAEEISVVAGIDHSVAEAITDRVRRFEQERSRLDPALLRPRVHERLRAALDRLGQLQEQFERAELEEAVDRKRATRRAREAAKFELDLLLSEIGELSLIEDLKRCAMRNKIQRVESYLEHAQAAAHAGS